VQLPDAALAAYRDRDIVRLLQDGAVAAAFEKLVDRYESKIYRLCCALLRDPSLAEDAAQESLLRIWRALARYDRRASLSTWIYAITRNRCLTAIDRRRAAGIASDADGRHRAADAAAPAPAEIDDQAALLRELVDALPERYRRAVTLYYFEERSITEAALMLGVPEGTLKTNLFRARSLLLERMNGMGLSDPGCWLGGPLHVESR
jgi:RNA polymerase sigma-70 factor (ECF subfamily)